MMMQELIIKKGYTITVVSWENDGDYYDTNSVTVDTLEKAKCYFDFMQLCVSKNNQPKGVVRLGNSESFTKEQINLIREFMEKHSNVLNIENEFDSWEDFFYTIPQPLLGDSEYYMCRVMDSCVVTYSEVDVYCNVIFKS